MKGEKTLFWEIYLKLCNQNNISPNGVAKKLNIPSGSVTTWKNGSVPRQTTLLKIADFFGVSVDFLLGKVTNITGNYNAVNNSTVTIGDTSKTLSEQEQEILRIYNTLSTKEKAELFLKICEYEKKDKGE